MSGEAPGDVGGTPCISVEATLREALGAMMMDRVSRLVVTRDERPVGVLTLDALVGTARHG